MNTSNSREEKLEALLDASQILNTSQDTDQILKSLLELSLDLIDGGDTGCIFLHNKLSGLLEMHAYVGMGDSVKNLKMLPGESMTGLAFLKKEAILFPDRESVKKSMGTMSEENIELALSGDIDPARIHGSICCPLLYRNEALGVLVIDDFKNNAPLTEDDVDLLKAISVQATIAVINAMNLEKELENNRKLEKYNKIIENQRNMYKYSTQVHGKFTDMVLNGSSLDDILREVKALSGKDVFLIDLFYNIANQTFEKKLPPKFQNLRPIMIDKLKKHKKTVFFESNSDMHFFSFPIMVNKEAMGWLCLISKTIHLTENEVITAERSATILAIEMLKQNELTDLEQSLKGDFLDSLLAENNTDYLQKYSVNYQFDIYSSHRILLIKFVFNPSTSPEKEKSEKHIRDCLKRYYRPFNEELRINFPGSFSLIRRHYIVCVLESASAKDEKHILSILDMIKVKFHQNYSQEYRNLQIKIGVSDSFESIKDFKEAFDNTIQTVKMIEDTITPIKTLFFKDIEIKRLLLANENKHLEQFCDKLLSPLLAYENSSKKDFLKTLEVYLKTNCSWSASKDILHIHGNTLTYRLNRISAILGVDLKNYQDRLRLQIAFEIKDLLQ
jgi:sugar diacid utilization regulator